MKRTRYYLLKKINENEYIYWCSFSGFKTLEHVEQAKKNAEQREPKATFIIEKHTIEEL